MIKSQSSIKSNLLHFLVAFLFLTTNTTVALAAPNKGQAPETKAEVPNECEQRPPDEKVLKKGLAFRAKLGYKIRDMVKNERAKGYEPQIFIIGRAGRDFSGAMILRDLDRSGNAITVKDIFNDVLGQGHQRGDMYSNGSEGGSSRTAGVVQNEIKKKYQDKNRKMVYSHMGILVLNHSIKTVEHTFDKGEKHLGEGEFYVSELLKPCDSLKPKAWITGLSGFFQDDPNEYRTIISVPTPEVQTEIKKIIDEQSEGAIQIKEGKNNFDLFLGDHYNAAAQYTDLREQNSNSFVLEVIAAAQMKVKTDKINSSVLRSDVLNYLKQTGYRSTKIIADSFFTSMATSVFAPDSLNIKDEDHPYARPYAVSEFVTEISVREWMQRTGIVPTENDIHEFTMTDKQLEEQQEVRRITPEQRDLWIKKAKESAALKKAAAAKLEAEQAAGLKK